MNRTEALEHTDFRSYLQAELIRRCRANPKYSLRAFARTLRIEPSALSKILNGKRRITTVMFRQLSKRLALDPVLAEKLQPPSQAPRSQAKAQAAPTGDFAPKDYRQLSLDMFQIISDWYHYAILELTQLNGFKPEPRWVARKLGITVSEVNIAVERLERIGFLKITSEGKWIDESGAVTTVGNEFTAIAFRKLQRQILEKAIDALEEIPMEERDQSSMTLVANSRLLPQAKERIKRFRRELTRFLKSEGPYDTVYHLGVSLYPVVKGDQ